MLGWLNFFKYCVHKKLTYKNTILWKWITIFCELFLEQNDKIVYVHVVAAE